MKNRQLQEARVGPLESERGFGLIEAIIAIVIFAIALLAIGGISLSVSGLTRISLVRTDQALATQVVLEDAEETGYLAVTSGTVQVPVGEHTYEVERTVTDVSARVKEIRTVVEGRAGIGPDTSTTRIHYERPLPTP